MLRISEDKQDGDEQLRVARRTPQSHYLRPVWGRP